MTRLLVDSDAFVLFAGSGLLEELVDALGFSTENVRRLSALPHMLQRGTLRKKLPETVLERSLAWCETIPSLDQELPSLHWLEALAPIDDIDPGEALLLSWLAEDTSSLLLTGDKRALGALSRPPALEPLRRILAERICCVETALRLCVETRGLRQIASAMTPLREYQKMIRIVFSRGEDTRVEDFHEAIRSYENALREKTEESLLLRPFKTP